MTTDNFGFFPEMTLGDGPKNSRTRVKSNVSSPKQSYIVRTFTYLVSQAFLRNKVYATNLTAVNFDGTKCHIEHFQQQTCFMTIILTLVVYLERFETRTTKLISAIWLLLL